MMLDKIVLVCGAVLALTTACSDGLDDSHTGHLHDPTGSGASAANDIAAAPPCAAGEPPPALGLMTSLPLNWELGTDIGDFAKGTSKRPWQAAALSRCFSVLPMDTLSPMAGLGAGDAETDPLAGLKNLAIIQPRGLSPSDNVALDSWVREGGQLLMVLDPLLTGHYDLPLGDPRRPAGSALYILPPVIPRWGLEAVYDEPAKFDEGVDIAAIGDAAIRIEHGFGWKVIDPGAASCDSASGAYSVRCKVGEGHVTLFGDAALFEHREAAGDDFGAITALLGFAFPS